MPPLCRQYVLRLVGAHGTLPADIVRSWPLQSAEAQRKHEEALRQLDALRLLAYDVSDGGSGTYQLHAGLCEQLQRSLCAAHAQADDGDASAGADKYAPSVPQLEVHARATWENVLQCVLTPPRRPVDLAVGDGKHSLQDLLLGLGLLEPAPAAVAHVGERELWRRGPRAKLFVLLPVHTQVWRLMLGYMELAERCAAGARDGAAAAVRTAARRACQPIERGWAPRRVQRRSASCCASVPSRSAATARSRPSTRPRGKCSPTCSSSASSTRCAPPSPKRVAR
eukprot:3319348-Prymnesium_polylepis.1